jgi:hypothetical protein
LVNFEPDAPNHHDKHVAATESICQVHEEASNRTVCTVLAKTGEACYNILSALSSQKKLQWGQVIMPHCPIELISYVSRAAAQSGARAEWQTRFYFLTLDSPNQLSAAPPPRSSDFTTPFRIRRLHLEEAEAVDASWRFRSAHSLALIRDLIGSTSRARPRAPVRLAGRFG